MDDLPVDFAKYVHSYLGDFIRAADQKAAFLLVASTALFGWLIVQTGTGCTFWVRLVALILLGLSGTLAVVSVMPRQHGVRTGLIAWNGILQSRTPDAYYALISELSDGGLKEASNHSYHLAEILRTKYRLLSAAIWPFILGAVMTVGVVILNAQAQNKTQTTGTATCGIKADLRGVQVLNQWNPNSLELDYLVTNGSAEDYVLPDRFRVMRKTSDGVLHGDAGQVGLPSERFFPRNHAVDFAMWINIGNRIDRSPTDDEKREMLKQLAGTKAYILFDDRGCEIQLPVARE
jgi:hypothetical protein